MAILELPDRALLLKLLRYEPSTGLLYWKAREPWDFQGTKKDSYCKAFNSKWAGQEVGKFQNVGGYRQISVLNRAYVAHRLIWKMVTGDEPPEVDHINGDPNDNRWINLRAVTRSENNRNMAMPSTNTSGFVGVSWSKRSAKWRADIQVDGHLHYLGLFVSKDDAILARAAAAERLGFHKNHGRQVVHRRPARMKVRSGDPT